MVFSRYHFCKTLHLKCWLGFEYTSDNTLFYNKWRQQYLRISSTFSVICWILKLLLCAKELLITSSKRVSVTSNWFTHNLTSNWFIIRTTSDQLYKFLWWNKAIAMSLSRVSNWPIVLQLTLINFYQMQVIVLFYSQKLETFVPGFFTQSKLLLILKALLLSH